MFASSRLHSRRQFLGLSVVAAAGAVLLTACGQAPAASPTTAPAPAAPPPPTATPAAAPAAAQTVAAAPTPTSAPPPAPTAAPSPTAAPAAASNATSAGSAQIRVATWAGITEQKQLQSLLDSFMAKNPKVKATIEPATDQYRTRMLTLFAAGNGPDTLWLEPTDVLAFAKRQVIVPLDAYRKAKPADTAEIYPVLLQYFTIDGKLYALPKDWFPGQILYVNKNAFQEAGVKLPSDGWTWTDFLATSKALTKTQGGKIQRYGYSSGIAYFWWSYWMRANGGDTFDDPLNPKKFTMTDKAATDGLQFFADLWLKEKVAPNPTTQDLGMGLEQGFTSQRIAIGTWGTWVIVTVPLKDITDFEWDIVPPPVAPGHKPANVLVANTYAIGHDTKQPDASWDFVSFVAGSKEGQALNSRSGLAAPTIPSVANSTDFKVPSIKINWDVFLKTIAYAQWGPRHTAWPEIQNTINPALDAIWHGSKTAAAAIAEIAPKVNDLLATG